MIVIAHRGLAGNDTDLENDVDQINDLYKNYSIISEIDFWHINGKDYIGHDIDLKELNFNKLNSLDHLFHAKTFESAIRLQEMNVHWFFHDKDDFCITSHGFLLGFENVIKKQNKFKTICVTNKTSPKNIDFNKFDAIVTDYPILINNILNGELK